jgi:hypothetical protein
MTMPHQCGSIDDGSVARAANNVANAKLGDRHGTPSHQDGFSSAAAAPAFIIGNLMRKSLIFVKAQDGTALYSDLGSCMAIVAMPAESKA